MNKGSEREFTRIKNIFVVALILVALLFVTLSLNEINMTHFNATDYTDRLDNIGILPYSYYPSTSDKMQAVLMREMLGRTVKFCAEPDDAEKAAEAANAAVTAVLSDNRDSYKVRRQEFIKCLCAVADYTGADSLTAEAILIEMFDGKKLSGRGTIAEYAEILYRYLHDNSANFFTCGSLSDFEKYITKTIENGIENVCIIYTDADIDENLLDVLRTVAKISGKVYKQSYLRYEIGDEYTLVINMSYSLRALEEKFQAYRER